MSANYTNRDSQHAPIEAVLLKLYTATFLKWLYEVALKDLALEHPDALPQLSASQRHGKARTPVKPYLIELTLAVLANEDLTRSMLDRLPKSVGKALAVLTWRGATPLDELELAAESAIADLNPEIRRWSYEPFLVRQEFGFIVFSKKDTYSYSYRMRLDDPPAKKDLLGELPQAIRNVFKKVFPPPDEYHLIPLDEIRDAIFHYSRTAFAVRDMNLVAEYIQQGHLQYTKSEKIAKGSVKAIQTVTQGAEFYEAPEDKDLEMLRARLILSALASVGNDVREHLLASSTADPARDLLNRLADQPAFFVESLQSYLGNHTWLGNSLDLKGVKSLISFFSKLPDGKWVSIENIRQYHLLRESVPTLIHRHPYLELKVEKTDRWNSRAYLRGDNYFELVSEPLLKGFAFFLASLGLAEIAYNLPTNKCYHLRRKGYLTPFDGLVGIRLTPLGDFALGKRETYDIENDALARTIVTLDPARLLATCDGLDPLTELSLKQFMETLAPGCFRMTHDTLLGGCSSRKGLEARIELFRRVVSKTPPPVWERFFESALSRIEPLTPEPKWAVLKIGGDDNLRRLFTTDPILREHSLKVEGLRIAVLLDDMKKVAKRLEHFGYLCPVSSMRSKEE